MSATTICILFVFVVGYFCIAIESFTKVNKAAITLLMCVVCWSMFMASPEQYVAATGHADLVGDAAGLTDYVTAALTNHLGGAAETLFFLMGAMTIVEVVDSNGGFNFVRRTVMTSRKRKLLWRIAFMTFFLSAILDNLTTAIVMIMVTKKLVPSQRDRWIYAAAVILAANAGGAFSPIGDITTIMLWIKGMITTQGVITEVFLPSVVSMVIPVLLLQFTLKGRHDKTQFAAKVETSHLTTMQRRIVFFLGVGGLMSVPVFRYITGLPPYMGILLVLGVLWLATEIMQRNVDEHDPMAKRVSDMLHRIDISTILFFLGILMTVNCLAEMGILTELGVWLNDVSGGNHYLVTGVIGAVSSVVDNVPLVAGCMGMYPIAPTGDMAVDGVFWQLLAYCAGVGGSMLIIGSAAGVVVMGLEKITFGWYLKHVTPVAVAGYLAGMLTYWAWRTLVGGMLL